jgi:hypothetical protein
MEVGSYKWKQNIKIMPRLVCIPASLFYPLLDRADVIIISEINIEQPHIKP